MFDNTKFLFKSLTGQRHRRINTLWFRSPSSYMIMCFQIEWRNRLKLFTKRILFNISLWIMENTIVLGQRWLESTFSIWTFYRAHFFLLSYFIWIIEFIIVWEILIHFHLWTGSHMLKTKIFSLICFLKLSFIWRRQKIFTLRKIIINLRLIKLSRNGFIINKYILWTLLHSYYRV